MKKFLCLILCFIFCLIITSCNISSNQDKSYETSEQEIINDETSQNEKINFDTSKYDAHGKISCGRLWVERSTEGDWNEFSENEFAYFDTDGNQITEWFNSSTYRKSNYVNNILIICCEENNRVSTGPRAFPNCKAYDINGKKLGGFSIVGEKSRSDFVAPCIANSTDKNQRIIQTIEDVDVMGIDYGISLIDEKGVHDFNCSNAVPSISGNFKEYVSEDDYIYNDSDDEEYDDYEDLDIDEDDYTEFDIQSGDNLSVLNINYDYKVHSYIFDQNYKIKFCVNDLIEKNEPNDITILPNNKIKVEFTGINGKEYTCILNDKGKFDKKPSLYK